MRVIMGPIQLLSVIVVIAYLLARTSFFDLYRQKDKNNIRELAAIILMFSCISLLSLLYGNYLDAETGFSTINVGAALAGLLFGVVPGVGVAVISSLAMLFFPGPTLPADILMVFLTGLFCGWYSRRMPELDAVLGGILVGLLEIIHMLLIVAVVRPLPEAKGIVYQIGFSMIILNGCAVILFIFMPQDFKTRRSLIEKETYLKSELNVATNIQMSLLDTNFTIDPRLDYHALLIPANEVGGDLYSFLKKDSDTFFFIIGDVSGKGIPAAITMSRAVALFQMNALHFDDPAKIMAAINDSLAVNNKTAMFITAIIGRLNFQTGELVIANAGHTPPFLYRGGEVARLPKPRGMALGMLNGRSYKTVATTLEEGQLAVFYTDGVSEAEDRLYRQFGEDKIESTLKGLALVGADQLNQALYAAVVDFAAGNRQSDDIAIATVGWRRLAPKIHLETANEITNLVNALTELDEWLAGAFAPRKLRDNILLVTEELATNIVKYSYPDGRAGNVAVDVSVGADRTAEVTIIDDGDFFDPFQAPAPNLEQDPMQRPIGGLGIFLIKKRITDYRYTSENGKNTLWLRVGEGGGGAE